MISYNTKRLSRRNNLRETVDSLYKRVQRKKYICIALFFFFVLFCGQNGLAAEYTNATSHLIIPSFVNAEPVTSIGQDDFSMEKIHTVVIPNTVKSIDDHAFAGFTSLYAMVIPETVTSIADNAFSNMHYLFTIITPKESYASSFARSKGINCVQLPQTRIEEADDIYISTLLFKLNIMHSRFFSMSADKGNYLNKISNKWLSLDSWMLGANNRNAVLGLLGDLFSPGDGNIYMAEKYSEQIGNILNDMKNFKPTQIDADILTKPAEALSAGYKGYVELVTWLNGQGLPPDDPFVRAVMNARVDLENYADTVGSYADVVNFILYYLTDYSNASEMLELLQEMATDSTFLTAVNKLKVDYDTSVAGILNKGIQEILLPQMLSVAKEAADEALPLLGYYTIASKALDIALKVSGSKEFRGDQLTYLSLHEICCQAEIMCRKLIESRDYSIEGIRKLQMACEFYRVALCRLYQVQLKLCDDMKEQESIMQTLAYYESARDLLFSQYSHVHNINGNAIASFDKLSTFYLSQKKEGETLYLDAPEYYYVENIASEKIDDIWLGEMASNYVTYAGCRNALDLVDCYVWDGGIDTFNLNNIVDIRLVRSECYKQETEIVDEWEGHVETYVNELWTEFYLFSGTMVVNDRSRAFELLLLFEGSGFGGNNKESILYIY